MDAHTPQVSLGFTEERFPAGVHICQIFSNDQEREEALFRFVVSGLQAGERTCCFSDKTTASAAASHLAEHAFSYDECCASGALTLARTQDVYFEGNRFDPDRMSALLATYHEHSVQHGYPAARVIGEMTPAVQTVPGGSRLLEYESKVSVLLRTHPITCVCQYDARSFDGAMIMDVLKVHPLMVIRGSVVRNPFFVRPEDVLQH